VSRRGQTDPRRAQRNAGRRRRIRWTRCGLSASAHLLGGGLAARYSPTVERPGTNRFAVSSYRGERSRCASSFDEIFSDQVFARKIEDGKVLRDFFARTKQPLLQDWLIALVRGQVSRLPVGLLKCRAVRT
jgi:hypothetical protein